jgi:hypothetical protein
MDDVTSGSCEPCSGCDCYICGLQTVEGMHSCAASCPNYVALCVTNCDQPCDTFSCPPAECAGCDATSICHPDASDWHDDNCAHGDDSSGPDLSGILPVVFGVLASAFVGFVIRNMVKERRDAANKSPDVEQSGAQMAQGRAPKPAAQLQAVPAQMVPMQIVLPPGATPGQPIQVNVNGQMMTVVVPAGTQPGGQITIQVPALQQAVCAVPMTADGGTVHQGIVLN